MSMGFYQGMVKNSKGIQSGFTGYFGVEKGSKL